MTSRWDNFRAYEDRIPETPYEACVFIDNAIHHLWNLTDRLDDSFWILNDAYKAIIDSEWERRDD